MTAATIPVTIPETIELCTRSREGHACLGVVFRGQPDLPRCVKCGGTEPGVIYVLSPWEQEVEG